MAIHLSLMQNIENKFRIIPLIIAVTLVVALLIIAITPPATGYEISIYDAYSGFLWVLISINILLSIYLIISRCEGESKSWLVGFFSILLLESIILLLPIIRGYFAMNRGGGDIFHHLSTAIQILNFGQIPTTDMYPMMHILLALLQFTSIDLMMLSFLLSIAFFISYVLYFYILGRTVLNTTKGGMLFSIFALPLIFSFSHYAYYPFQFALYLIPLELFILSKLNTNIQNKSGYYVCLVAISLFIVYCHPVIAIFNFIMFSIFALIRGVKQGTSGLIKSNVAMNTAFISFVTFSLWYIQHMNLMRLTQGVLSKLLGDSVPDTILDYQMSVVSTSDASLWLIADRFIKIYGTNSLYIFISVIFILYIIIQYYRHGKVHSPDAIYSLQFIVAICIGFVFVVADLIIFELIRTVSYALIFCTLLCGLFFYRLSESRSQINRVGSINLVITLIISTVCILSMLTLFPSPWTGAVNPAFTFAEKQGTDWTIDNNINVPILTNELRNTKFIDYHNQIVQNDNLQRPIIYHEGIPSHFGYNETWPITKSVASLDEGTLFMVTTDLMKLTPYAVPIERRNRLKWFEDSDFSLLNQDPTVDKVYSNNGYEAWRIIPS